MANGRACGRIKAHLPQAWLLGTEVVEKAQDKDELQERLRAFTGRSDLQVLGIHKVVGQDGKTTGYKIDIR